MACISSDPTERYSFAAGPAMLPSAVLTQIQNELPDWNRSGFSLLEQPFTSPAFKQLMVETEQNLRKLLAVPNNYRVLFAQGGASAQFGLVPLNLLQPGQSADYLESGHWACKAIVEARRHSPVNVVASGAADGFSALPKRECWQLDPHAGYCHITSNETGNGLQLRDFPDVPVPLVADMTSDFLTRPIPVERFGLIYASAQKNFGIAGLCLLIVREDLLRSPQRGLPAVFSFKVQAEQQSRFNTPPTFALYVAALMLRWIEAQGGLAAMEAHAREKSQRLYRCIEAGSFYRCRQQAADRSSINVCFELADARLLQPFLADAERNGLFHLQGHSHVGGVRASLYNAMPLAGVDRLVAFMRDFESRHG
ncbi:3-phosphoserine/phosphohydroxythreonine transaminase [Pseudomonas sp. Choline-3u-10]|jgi:phosphoserine aminotransferase|uniref:3-phosphoserine/phosphohydroxythreonine transaminase n=1 Tax=Pseudomonadaceae TaxID=135621 RepID=UPI0006181124|nr:MULTISPECIES: 3-phosphoserine/phosphohydroxythreonine transaminase [Pseudomonadaceae]MBU0950832.1 3-phosphoserine/phosphohydroxythreonine transaminase [Gammaproteobacteria bacterium]HBM09416.1 3-phosphoserine/phosphohydroxythreonine transaminase [Pseudomonas sp.]KJJ65157.1 MFS transporter [Pseudomonas sp. 10B238]MBK3795622.1 3-phosphoserine/phosphohydroxythreonine transaminase [Stutzerimonas stutzeri]MBK3878023.1 3-phosphoserine/phosphohydroxythreonine transaminase [Stutzerimonas stutzeri]|tara:strand:- start:1455 stop:2555 length:1101 start_codon:yes stop_codon:yes gene_type:complete